MQKGLQLEFRPANRWVQRFSKRNLVHIARTLTPTLTALLFASAAHAQGTMDFTGATTLMTTFNNRLAYPRVVYAVAVDLDRALDLADWSSSDPGKTIAIACLSIDDLTTSMAFAQILDAEGIQGLVFPSVVAAGDDNLVVYLSHCSTSSLALQNEQEIIEQAKRIATKHK